MGESSFLVPQREFADLRTAITQKPFYAPQDAHFSALRQSAPRGWSDFLHSRDPVPVEFAVDFGGAYTWTQNERTITVAFEPSAFAALSESGAIDCRSISTAAVSGAFFGEVRSYAVNEGAREVVLEAADAQTWPVLLCGDTADAYTEFLLSMFSLLNDGFEYFVYWATKAAYDGFSTAKQLLASKLLLAGEIEKSIYWYVQEMLESGDDDAKMIVAEYLMEANDENFDPFLSEWIIVDTVKKGNYEGLHYLGYLHLKVKGNQFKNNEQLGLRYLQESVSKTQNERSMELLEECSKSGIGCQKDAKEGKELVENSVEADKRDSRISSGTVISSIAIFTCVAVTAFNVYKRFIRK